MTPDVPGWHPPTKRWEPGDPVYAMHPLPGTPQELIEALYWKEFTEEESRAHEEKFRVHYELVAKRQRERQERLREDERRIGLSWAD